MKNIITLLYFVFPVLSLAQSLDGGSGVLLPAAPCVFNVNAGADTTICTPATIQLNGSTDLPVSTINSVYWQPGGLLSDSTILNPSATVSATTTFILTVSGGNNELIFNGDFSLGDTGFVSDYVQGLGGISGIVSDPGEYDINTNPHNSHIDFATFGDHTTGTGNMLIVNGSDIFNDTLWCQTVPVSPNNNYTFSAWASTANWQNPAIMRFMINSIPLGLDLYLTADTGLWNQFTATWNSGTATSANVCISDVSTWSAGNDFVIDDISLTGICALSDTVIISIDNAPTVFLGNDLALCFGDTLELNAGSGFMQYSWQLDGATLGNSDSVLAVTQPGMYVVTVTSAGICTGSDTVMVTPGTTVINLPADTTICNGDTLPLNAPSGFATYQWFYNGISIGNSTSVNAISPGMYLLQATDSAGCSATDSLVVSFENNFLNAGSDAAFCAGDSALITLNNSVGLNIQLSINGTPSGPTVDSVYANVDGNYVFTGTSITGCQVSDTVEVVVNALPDVQTINDTTICTGSSVSLFTNGATTFQWSPVDYLNSISVADPVSSPLQPITYFVTGSDQNGCIGGDTVTIAITESPVASFEFTNEISCEGMRVEFQNKSTGATSYLWNFGDGSFSNESNAVHLFVNPGIYEVQLNGMNSGCADSVTASITFPTDAFQAKPVNIFTPNQDQLNDCFDGGVREEFIDCSNLEVFSRWGQQVFKSDGDHRCWNGRSDSDGELVPEGFYFYILSFKSQSIKGTVFVKW